jgi:cellobiose-specific phosphotransferase system component IIC
MSRSSAASRPSSAGSSFVRALHRIAELPFVAAVREALPWSFIGLAATFVAVLAARSASGADAGAPLGLRLASALLPGFGVMSATLVVVLALKVSKRAGYAVGPVLLASAADFALALPRPFGPDPAAYLRTLGTCGLFIALIACGVTAAWIGAVKRQWPGALASVATFAMLPALHVSIGSAIAAAMQPLAQLGDSYAALLVIVLIETLLWAIGVHGPALLAAVVTPVYLTMQMQNTHAFAAHQPLPFIVVVSLFLFVFPGGAGATLPLAVLLAASRVPRLRRVGRATLVPAFFNINEPLLFGAPVVFNPHLAIPFVAAPLLLASTTYAAVATGVVARAAFYVPSSVPTPISTYLATLDPRAPVLALFNIGIATLVYWPFVRLYERHVA